MRVCAWRCLRFKYGTVTSGEFRDHFLAESERILVAKGQSDRLAAVRALDFGDLFLSSGMPKVSVSHANSLAESAYGLSKKWAERVSDASVQEYLSSTSLQVSDARYAATDRRHIRSSTCCHTG